MHACHVVAVIACYCRGSNPVATIIVAPGSCSPVHDVAVGIAAAVPYVAAALFVTGFYKNISRTSAVSSTNFGPILIFASCVVGTCDILCR